MDACATDPAGPRLFSIISTELARIEGWADHCHTFNGRLLLAMPGNVRPLRIMAAMGGNPDLAKT